MQHFHNVQTKAGQLHRELHKPFSRLLDAPVYLRLEARLALVDLSSVALAERSRVADADTEAASCTWYCVRPE